MNNSFDIRFLKDCDNTGRFIVVSKRTERISRKIIKNLVDSKKSQLLL